MKLGFLALILQILGKNSRTLAYLSVSLSKIKFWPFSFSLSLQNGCCAPFYILGFRAQRVRMMCLCCSEYQFSLQRVLSVCTPGPLDLDTFAAANLVLAAARSYFTAANTLFFFDYAFQTMCPPSSKFIRDGILNLKNIFY